VTPEHRLVAAFLLRDEQASAAAGEAGAPLPGVEAVSMQGAWQPVQGVWAWVRNRHNNRDFVAFAALVKLSLILLTLTAFAPEFQKSGWNLRPAGAPAASLVGRAVPARRLVPGGDGAGLPAKGGDQAVKISKASAWVAASVVAMASQVASADGSMSNVALGKPVTASGSFDSLPSALATLTDGVFLPQGSFWKSDTVNWDRRNSSVVIVNLQGAFDLNGVIVQVDNNDAYVLEYHDPATGEWKSLWSVPNYAYYGGATLWGMHTRPNPYDSSIIFSLPAAARADQLRLYADPLSGDGACAVSEIQAFGLESDCNGDGFGDISQISSGELIDANGNGIPDCCEDGTTCTPSLIVNSGFESGSPLNACASESVSAGNLVASGWQVTTGTVDRTRGGSTCASATQPKFGDYCIDLCGTPASSGAIKQLVPTVPGHRYRCTFWLSGDASAGTAAKKVHAKVGTYIDLTYTFNCSGVGAQNWVSNQFEFTARGANEPLEFVADNGVTTGGPMLDSINLVDITTQCVGDLDASGQVDGADIALLLLNFGDCPVGP